MHHMDRATQRRILHLDMDAFFAAVEQLDHPEWRGEPLLVGGDPKGRGVVSTASYEARPFGCHSAMPMAAAIRLCPQAIVVKPRMERYVEVSHQVFDTLEQFTPLVEPIHGEEFVKPPVQGIWRRSLRTFPLAVGLGRFCPSQPVPSR